MRTKRLLLNIAPRMWARFRKALLDTQGNGREVFGILFCKQHRVTRRVARLLPVAWVVPMGDCYERQSAGGLALRQEFHWHLLKQYVEPGLDVVHIHTHPWAGKPQFSIIDDQHESEYARFLSGFPNHPIFVSGVFDNEIRDGRFRAWRWDGAEAGTTVAFTSAWVSPRAGAARATWAPERFDRQKVFGTGVQQMLGDLRVGLVGCGGIGAPFAEQLARLGVRKWVLIDPDHLETSNLNRMPGATIAMVQSGWSKVWYVNNLINQAWQQGAEVEVLCSHVEDETCRQALVGCDLIVAATDNHHSRMVCQEIALEFQRPLICLGTHIQVSEASKTCRILSRVTVPPLGGGWCLMCGDVIDANQAALEAAPGQIAAEAANAGYLQGVPAPAVYWPNNICASLGVDVIHSTLSGMMDVSDGVDWVMDFSQRKWLEIRHEDNDRCFYCSPDSQLNAGKAVVNTAALMPVSGALPAGDKELDHTAETRLPGAMCSQTP